MLLRRLLLRLRLRLRLLLLLLLLLLLQYVFLLLLLVLMMLHRMLRSSTDAAPQFPRGSRVLMPRTDLARVQVHLQHMAALRPGRLALAARTLQAEVDRTNRPGEATELPLLLLPRC